MKRRSFIKSSAITAVLGSILPMSSGAAAGNKKTKQELYELRTYYLKNKEQEKLVLDYFENAAIPALNRLGSKPIGVFTELNPEGQTKLFVIIPFQSVNEFMNMDQKLSGDAAYMQAAAAYLNAPASAPAYDRIESALLGAFAQMPRIVIPERKPRIFELRRYESATEAAGKKKMEMFNDAGEIAIFKRTGLTPVFFGETLIGVMRPNLTYMLTFDDMEEHDRNWKTFGSDPEWKKISSMPEYSNDKIVSRITRTFLTPAACSQV